MTTIEISPESKMRAKRLAIYLSSISGRKLTGLFVNAISNVLVHTNISYKEIAAFHRLEPLHVCHFSELLDGEFTDNLAYFFPKIKDNLVYINTGIMMRTINAALKDAPGVMHNGAKGESVTFTNKIGKEKTHDVYLHIRPARIAMLGDIYNQIVKRVDKCDYAAEIETRLPRKGTIVHYPVVFHSKRKKDRIYNIKFPILDGVTCVSISEFDKKMDKDKKGKLRLLLWEEMACCKAILEYSNPLIRTLSYCSSVLWF